MIARSIPHDTIRYILGATGEGRQHLRRHPALPISWVDYIFIDGDERVRAWLLSNPVLEDPLDLLVYCHRTATPNRLATPPLPRRGYLADNAVTNWAREGGAGVGGAGVGGALWPGAGAGDATPDPAQAPGDASGSSPSSSSSGGGGGCDVVPAPPIPRIPLGVKSPSLLNAQMAELEWRGARKHGAQFDAENSDEPTPKRLHLGLVVREVSTGEEQRKRGKQFGDENCELPKPKRLCLTPVGRGQENA